MSDLDASSVRSSFRPAALRAVAPARSPVRRAAPKQILVIDDDPEIREIIAVLLRGAGFWVDTAVNGEAGWRALRAKPYDLLIVDHLMPKLSGLDLLRRLRAVPMDLPCLLLSGAMPWQEADLPVLLQPGAAVEKPFSLPDLLAQARELLPATASGRESVSTNQGQLAAR